MQSQHHQPPRHGSRLTPLSAGTHDGFPSAPHSTDITRRSDHYTHRDETPSSPQPFSSSQDNCSRSSGDRSSPPCPSPPTIPSSSIAHCRPPSPEAGLPLTADDLVGYIRPRLMNGNEVQLLVPAGLAYELVSRLDILPRSDPMRHLRYAYHAPFSTLITKCMTATTHDCFHPYFVDCIDAAVDAAGITPAQARAFKITADNDVRNFTGIFTGSLKRGDLLVTPRPVIMLRHDIDDDSSDDDDDDQAMDDEPAPIDTAIPNDGFPTIAVEVGFSENYTSLLRDMRLWLEGAAGRVRVVILVNLIESPPVNLRPFVADPTFDDDVPAAAGVQQSDAARLRRFRREPGARYGPIMYRGHVLVGAITGTLELWRFDPVSKTPYMEARKVVLPSPGGGVDENEFTLTMMDLFGAVERVPGQCTPAQLVRFPLHWYRREIRESITLLANHRLDDVRVKRKKKAGEDAEWVGSFVHVA